jgi:hypothetical protein
VPQETQYGPPTSARKEWHAASKEYRNDGHLNAIDKARVE